MPTAKKRALSVVIIAALLVMLAACGKAAAAEAPAGFPERKLNAWNPFAAGGATDVIMRFVCTAWERELGETIVVESKPGASGELCWSELAAAKADGYTMAAVTSPSLQATILQSDTMYDMDSFEYIGLVMYHENILMVNYDSPFQTFEDFMAAAKADPGALTVGVGGAYSDDDLASMKMKTETGMDYETVIMNGSAGTVTAILGGHIDAGVANVSDAVQRVIDKEVRVLVTMGEERNANWPDVPTLKELGYDVIAGNSTAMVVPKGVPEAVLAYLRSTLKKAITSEEYIQKVGVEAKQPIKYLSAEEAKAEFEFGMTFCEELWKELGLPTL